MEVPNDQNLHTLLAAIAFCSGVLAVLWSGVVVRRLPGLRSLSPFFIGSGTLSIWLLVFAGRLQAMSGAGMASQP